MIRSLLCASCVGIALIAAGCSNNPAPTPSSAPVPATKPDGEHGHKPSAHGGVLVPIGGDNYHAEAVFEKAGTLRLFTLGKNEATVLEVESQELAASVRLIQDSVWEPLALKPEPQTGDKPGTTSQFVGQLPKGMAGKKVVVKISALRIGGERYRIAFESTPAADDHNIPTKIVDDDETKLYLTPWGKYTAADIAANGNVTASQKFKGLKAEHDLKPKVGDKICPITLTKASSKFAWIVDGKSYDFCCPPCVDEFVLTAKEKPAEMKPPEEFRQK